MLPALQKRFTASERFRQNIINGLQEYSEAQLAFRPAYKAWSIIQVLQHLMQAETAALGYMQKKNQAKVLPRAGVGAGLRSRMLGIVLHLPLKYRAPEGLVQPIYAMSFWEVVQRWNDTREEMEAFFSQLNRQRAYAALFRHPFAGYLNVFQAIHFFDRHMKHHLLQIKRIQAARDFPNVIVE